MIKLEETIKIRTDSEKEAQELIAQYKEGALSGGYIIKKAAYEYKEKKASKEVVDRAWPVTITMVFDTLWSKEVD